MKPEEGTKQQIGIFKCMSGKDRLKIAFEMWETALKLIKASEKTLHPDMSEKEIERLARKRMTDGATRSS